MSKTKVSVAEYVIELNDALEKHPGVQPGMRFFSHPEGGATSLGIGSKGGENVPGVFAAVRDSVDQLFEVDPPYI